MLEGLLVDLVPFGSCYEAAEYDWENGPAAFWSNGGNPPLASHARHTARQERRREQIERGTRLLFGIQTKQGAVIGRFGFNSIVPHDRLAMLGVMIGDSEYWGGGYGTDAVLLALDYAFGWLDMHKIWLATLGPNQRMIRQSVKLGFTLEARQRESTFADGEWEDILLYGLLREDWPGRAAMIEQLGLTAKGR